MGNNTQKSKYDEGYKKELSKKTELIHFLRKYVKASWTRELNPEDITLCDKEFILQDFEMRESDLIFKVVMGKRTFYIYLLMELQSSVDFTMPFRLLIYMTNLWLKIFQSVPKNERERKDFKLPVILPIVFYNGETRWTAETRFSSYQTEGNEFAEHVVNFEYYVVDLSQIEKEEILSTNTLLDNIMALDKGRNDDDLIGTLQILMDRLSKLPKGEQAAFISWLEHVLKKNEFQKEYIDNVIRFMKEGGFHHMVTYSIERIIDRDRNESKRLGRAESILILLEDLGVIPDTLRDKILAEKDMDTLKTWLHDAKRAQSIDEFERIMAFNKTES